MKRHHSVFPVLRITTTDMQSVSVMQHLNSIPQRAVHYELNGKAMKLDLHHSDSYKTASKYLLATWGDDPTFYLTGES